MATGDLTTISNVKSRLGVSSGSDDAILTQIVTAASAFAQTWMGRAFQVATYTESYDGRNSDTIMVRNGPIVSVASITADGVAVIPYAGFGTQGFVFDDSFIYYIGATFTKGRRNVALVYNGGYATTPSEISESVIELVGIIYKEKDRIGQSSKGIGPEHVSYIVKDVPDRVKTIWQQYKRVVFPT